MRDKKRMMLLAVGDLAVFALSFGAWIALAAGAGGGRKLTDVGIRAMRYFTVDSNLLAGAAAAACLLAWLRRNRSWEKIPPVLRQRLQILRLAGAASTGITFLTVLVFLGPRLGYAPLFAGPNLVMHMIVPLLAGFLFMAGRCGEEIPARRVAAGAIPVAVYALFYAGNILINGREDSAGTNDWYGFAQWGPAMYLPVILLMTGAALALSFLLWKGGGGGSKRSA